MPEEQTSDGTRFTVDRELVDGERICVKGSDGALVFIYCLLGGTSVTIYEHPDTNPLAEIYTKRYTRNEGTQGDHD